MKKKAQLAVLVLVMLAGLYSFDHVSGSGSQSGILTGAAILTDSTGSSSAQGEAWKLLATSSNAASSSQQGLCIPDNLHGRIICKSGNPKTEYETTGQCNLYCKPAATGTGSGSDASGGSSAGTATAGSTEAGIVAESSPKIGSVLAAPKAISKGGEFVIVWEWIENADVCELLADGTRIKNPNKGYITSSEFRVGSRTLSPEKTTEYQIRCHKATGSTLSSTDSEKVKITVGGTEGSQASGSVSGTGEDEKKPCSDSDGGKNYYEKGTAKGLFGGNHKEPLLDNPSYMELTDACDESNNKYLNEFYCDEAGYVRQSYYDCTNGCSDSACIKSSGGTSDSSGRSSSGTAATGSGAGAGGGSGGKSAGTGSSGSGSSAASGSSSQELCEVNKAQGKVVCKSGNPKRDYGNKLGECRANCKAAIGSGNNAGSGSGGNSAGGSESQGTTGATSGTSGGSTTGTGKAAEPETGNLVVDNAAVTSDDSIIKVKATIRNAGTKRVYIGPESQKSQQGETNAVFNFLVVTASIEKDGVAICRGRDYLYTTLAPGATTNVLLSMNYAGSCSLQAGSSYIVEAEIDSEEWMPEASENDNAKRQQFTFGASEGQSVACTGYTVGLRTADKYCYIDNALHSQKGNGERCYNNFECVSNVCVAGLCVSGC